jgi:hypothetical protein
MVVTIYQEKRFSMNDWNVFYESLIRFLCHFEGVGVNIIATSTLPYTHAHPKGS